MPLKNYTTRVPANKSVEEIQRMLQKEGEEVAPEILAKSIIEVSNAMKVFSESRLKRATIVTLIHAQSKVAKRDIELVLNNLEELEHLWLKPLK